MMKKQLFLMCLGFLVNQSLFTMQSNKEMQNKTDTCLLKTVLLEAGSIHGSHKEEIIKMRIQSHRIIHNYTTQIEREEKEIEKGWRDIKMTGYEFVPRQSSKTLTDSDEANPLYDFESIVLNLDPKTHL